MQSESLRFIGKPYSWEHNCGMPSLASFLGLFYLQTNYPGQALRIHSITMIGLIPRNHFEQPGNLISLGKGMHIVTGFFNWVPNEWQVYEIDLKELGYSVMSVIIRQSFADKSTAPSFTISKYIKIWWNYSYKKIVI